MMQQAWTRLRTWAPVPSRLLRFGMVGITGTAVNSLVLWVLVHYAGAPVALASLVATELAIINNFLLNDYWTFRARARQRRRLHRLLRFNGVSLGGLCITVCVVASATAWLHMHLIAANLLASGLTLAWNYTVNSRWTWREPAGGIHARPDGLHTSLHGGAEEHAAS